MRNVLLKIYLIVATTLLMFGCTMSKQELLTSDYVVKFQISADRKNFADCLVDYFDNEPVRITPNYRNILVRHNEVEYYSDLTWGAMQDILWIIRLSGNQEIDGLMSAIPGVLGMHRTLAYEHLNEGINTCKKKLQRLPS